MHGTILKVRARRQGNGCEMEFGSREPIENKKAGRI